MKDIELVTIIRGWKQNGSSDKVELKGHLSLDEALILAKEFGFQYGDGEYIGIEHDAKVIHSEVFQGNLYLNTLGEVCQRGDLSRAELQQMSERKKNAIIEKLSENGRALYLTAVDSERLIYKDLSPIEKDLCIDLFDSGLLFKTKHNGFVCYEIENDSN